MGAGEENVVGRVVDVRNRRVRRGLGGWLRSRFMSAGRKRDIGSRVCLEVQWKVIRVAGYEEASDARRTQA